MGIHNNYLLLFRISIKDSYSFKRWADIIAKANEEANKHRPKSTLASPAQKARYQTLLDKVKELESKANDGCNFTAFIQAQRQEMLAFQAEKTEEIKRTLRFCNTEKLKAPDFAKKLLAEYEQFQITKDVILSLIKAVIAENESGTGGDEYSDYLTKEDAKAVESALINAGLENASLYEVLEKDENSTIEELQKQAGKCYENARKSNNSTLSALFGQCLKVFKTTESKQRYDNYLKISKYKKINRNVEDPIRLTGITSITESITSKIITQAVKDYPELSRAQAAAYIKSYCEYWGYEVSIAANEFAQASPPPRPEVKEEDKIDKLLQNAEDMFKKAKDPERAEKLYEEAINLAPTNPYGWLGMAFVITEDFSTFTTEKMEKAQKYATKALNVASGDSAAIVHSKWDTYINTYNSKQTEYRRRIAENEKQYGILFYRNDELKDNIHLYRNGKTNFFTGIWMLIKLAFAAIVSSAILVGLVTLIEYIDSVIADFDNEIISIIVALLCLAIIFGIPALIFVLLIKKLLVRKISKKTQQKLIDAEQEFIENSRKMESLNQEIKQLRSYL